jgi:LAO/AO transport system kinase
MAHVDVADLVSRAREGQARAVGRLISLVEQNSAELRAVTALLSVGAGRAHVVGLTGPPGVGKSTMTSALVSAYRAAGSRVGVLAVDPTSPFSGGALLGDRIRMGDHALDDGVFIRSMATRGHLGGLSSAVPQAIRVLDAAGFDVVLVETVGVGQSEVEVAAAADTTVVLLAPGMGDSIQAAKAGILEIADIFVVNKADRPGVEATARELRQLLAMGEGARSGPPNDLWLAPVVRTIATTLNGVEELRTELLAHRDWLLRTEELVARRTARADAEIQSVAIGLLRSRLTQATTTAQREALARRVAQGELDPYVAADDLMAAISVRESGQSA